MLLLRWLRKSLRSTVRRLIMKLRRRVVLRLPVSGASRMAANLVPITKADANDILGTTIAQSRYARVLQTGEVALVQSTGRRAWRTGALYQSVLTANVRSIVASTLALNRVVRTWRGLGTGSAPSIPKIASSLAALQKASSAANAGHTDRLFCKIFAALSKPARSWQRHGMACASGIWITLSWNSRLWTNLVVTSRLRGLHSQHRT